MGRLSEFETKDFIEQVGMLGAVVQEKAFDSIPELASLMDKIAKYEAVWLVMRDSLKSLLSGSEEHTVNYLKSGNPEIRKICIEVAGQTRMAAAMEPLLALQASGEQDPVLLFDVLNALSLINPEGSADMFRKFLDHEDSVVSSKSIDVLGELNDIPSFDRLCSIIRKAESNIGSGLCDLPTASAIKALGKYRGGEAVEFFIARLHHANPGVRRLIHHELVCKGSDAVDALGRVSLGDDVDSCIFAANILGLMGKKEVTNVLVKALEKGQAVHPNVRYAVYEAIGRTGGMAGLVALVDGLRETDEMVLMAVVSSIDMHLNQWILDKVRGMVREDTDHGRILVKAIIASGALNLFEGLYHADDDLGVRLVKEIRHSGGGEFIGRFHDRLSGMDIPRAKDDAQSLDSLSVKSGGMQILAVDDSRAMLNFYQSVTASLGLNIVTALNGKEALDILEKGESFDLIITDMNMPVMDGIEFTKQVRGNPLLPDMPIIMITTESERSQQDLAMKAGATYFMQKPFSAEKLQEKIKACLGL